MNEALSKAVNSYENIIVIRDLNIDVSDPDKDRNNYLPDFVDTFSLSNLINRKTCHKNLSGTTVDIMLTNRPNCFQKTSTVVTGLSDVHKMIISCLKTTFKNIPPKKIIFRDYKKFDEQNFLYDLDQQMIKGKFYEEKYMYESFSDTFKAIVEKTLKTGKNRKINVINFVEKLKRTILGISQSNLNSKKKFWQFVKPFLTNIGVFGTDFISIKKDSQFIDNEIELVEMFDSH